MWLPGYRRRLARDSARWVSRGWISAEARAGILEEAGAAGSLSRTLAMLGALLAGIGVVTFVAANWDAMTAAGRLGALLAALLASLAACWVAEGRGGHWLDAAALLTLLVFGANIHLVGQTFHIAAHWPDGVLLWALGGVALAWLLRVESAMLGALLLGLLWSAGEVFEFERILWTYPGLLVLTAALILPRAWEASWRLWILSLAWWLLTTALLHYRAPWEMLQWLGLLGLAALALGARLQASPHWAWTSRALLQFGVFGVLGVGLLFSYPDTWDLGLGEAGALPGSWPFVLILGLVGAALLLARDHIGWHELAAWTPLAAVLLLGGGEGERPDWVPVLINLLYFGGLLLLLWRAHALRERELGRTALGFFLLGLALRYLEQFWSLLDRSLVFVGAGALLFLVGWWLERRRRGGSA